MVAVSEKYNFAYLKTRKTASTSIEMYLQPLCTPPGMPVVERTRATVTDAGIIGSRLISPATTEPIDRQFRAHMPAKKLRDALGQNRWDELVKVTSVRNPFDKVLSSYFWNRKNDQEPASVKAEIADFRDYAFNGQWKNDRNIVFIDGVLQAKVAIRYEHMQEDLQAFLRFVGANDDLAPLQLTKVTKSKRRAELSDYYNKQTATHVRKRFRWMFRHFDYPTTIAATQAAAEARQA